MQHFISLNPITIPVTGVSFEGRQETIAKISNGDALRVIPNPTNPYDRHAVAVCTENAEVIGFIPAKLDIKDEIFDIVHHGEGKFVCEAADKRGGWKGANYGISVSVRFIPHKDEETEHIVKVKRGKHPTNRHDLNAKFKYKNYAVKLNHGFDSKEYRKENSRKLRHEMNNSLDPVGKTAHAKSFCNWRDPYIPNSRLKEMVMGDR